MFVRRFVGVLAACVLAGMCGAPVAGSDQPVVVGASSPTVVEVVVRGPKRVRVVHKRFVPWAQASVAQAHRIAAVEAARVGVSVAALDARIDCESTWQWDASNGRDVGILQFEPSTFERGLSTIGSRVVVLRSRTVRVVHAERVAVLSDGSRRVLRRWRRRQFVVSIMRGMIPRDPPVTHTWAQVRIASEALAGRSAVSSSEWECAA